MTAFGSLTIFSFPTKSKTGAISTQIFIIGIFTITIIISIGKSEINFCVWYPHWPQNQKQTNKQLNIKYEKRGSKGLKLTAIVLTYGMTAFGSLTIFSVPTKSENCADLQQP